MPLDNFSCFKCQVCTQVYQRPIKLPCNKTICYSHLCDFNGNIKTSFYCVFCENNHEIQPNRIYPNFYIQHQINKLEKQRPETDIASLISKAEESITEHFGQILNEILVHRETLKELVDKLCDKILEKAKTIESKFKSDLSQIKETFFANPLDHKLEEKVNDLIQDKMKSCKFEPNQAFQLSSETLFGKLNNGYKVITAYEDGTIRMKEICGDLRSKTFKGVHKNWIRCLQISSDNTRLISGGMDLSLKIWNLKNGQLLKNITQANKIYNMENKFESVRSIIKSSNENEIITSSSYSNIMIWNLDEGLCKKVLKGHTNHVLCLELLRNDRLLSGSSDLLIKIWNLNTFECEATLKYHKDAVKCLTKIDDHNFASGSDDFSINIWEDNDNEFKHQKSLYPYTGKIRQLKALKSSNLLVSLSNSIHLWNLDSFVLTQILTQNENSLPRCFTFLPNDRIIVGNMNKTLEVWCLNSGKSLKILEDHTSALCDIQVYFP
jgi:WD40 repeat protein